MGKEGKEERHYRFSAPRQDLLLLRARLLVRGRTLKSWLGEVMRRAARGDLPQRAPQLRNGAMRWVSVRLTGRDARAYDRAQRVMRAQGRSVAWLLRARIAEEVEGGAGRESVPVVRR